MSDETTTAKIRPGTEQDVARALGAIKKLGGLGTGIIGVLLFAGAAWLDSRIDARITAAVQSERAAQQEATSAAVREAVRAEIDPLKDRLTRLEMALEYERKGRGE